MSLPVILIFIGVLATVLALAFALIGPQLAARDRLRKRAQTLHRQAGGGTRRAKGAPPAASTLRRQQARSVPLVEDMAKRFLPRQSVLRDRLSRTGHDVSLGTYALFNIGIAAAAFLGTVVFAGLPVSLALLLAFVAGVGLPHVAVGVLAARYRKKFLGVFPDAVDLIVRGLRSGLPVTESIAVVGREMPDPVGAEFRKVTDSVRFGRTLEDVLWDTARRLDTPEFNFFVICLSIQRETGGNLGETLGNLSDLLRRRRQMRLKIKAMSSEAKASAYIIGALPFVMFVIVNLLNPEYASLLYTDQRGWAMLAAGLTSMVIGAAVMAKMTRFEI